MQNLDFPRYLKSSRLFIDIDVDYIVVAAISFFMSVAIAFMLNIPIVMAIFVILIGTAVPVRAYQRLMKTAAPGYLKHYIYSLGLVKKRAGKGSLPYGFDKVFED
jgi:hypothetical protein